MVDSRTIMMLGAGEFQLPAVIRALNAGLRVVTVDNIPESVCHKHSHASVNCSTMDVESVLIAAEKHRIDAVFSMASDVAIPAISTVSQKLNLPGPSRQASKIFTNKHLLRDFQKTNNLTHPLYSYAQDFDECFRSLPLTDKPLVVKPSSSSGSRGIKLIESKAYSDFKAAFNQAKSFSFNNTAVIEELLFGDNITAEGFLAGGKIALCFFTHKYSDNFVVKGHRVPLHLSRTAQHLVKSEITAHFRKSDYQDGPFDADLIVTPDNACIVEISPRLGGNGISRIIEYCYGVDLISLAIMHSLGDELEIPSLNNNLRGAASMLIGADNGGMLKNIAAKDEILINIPEVFEVHYMSKTGEEVKPFIHGGNAIGMALFEAADDLEYKSLIAIIYKNLKIEIN